MRADIYRVVLTFLTYDRMHTTAPELCYCLCESFSYNAYSHFKVSVNVN